MTITRDFRAPQIIAAAKWASELPATVDADQDVRMAGLRLTRYYNQVAGCYDPTRDLAAMCADFDRVEAAWLEEVRQATLREGRRSHYFGKAGAPKELELELTVSRIRPIRGEFGLRCYFFLRHEDGRLVRYLQTSGKPEGVEVGQRLRVRGRVKTHLKGPPEPMTEMTRCTLEKI